MRNVGGEGRQGLAVRAGSEGSRLASASSLTGPNKLTGVPRDTGRSVPKLSLGTVCGRRPTRKVNRKRR
jgi:hypothetical protein